MKIVKTTNFPDIPLFRRGKVRDVYDLGDKLLFVASDRISAFDVIMEEAVPCKGAILTDISKYWFSHTQHIIKNHLLTTDVSEYPAICQKYAEDLEGRSMLVSKSKPILLECVVRGYVAGSGWKEYKNSGTICGISIPSGLSEYEKLPTPIFTPSTKAEEGHDENITLEQAYDIVGKDIADEVKSYSLALYNFAYEHLYRRGIILADTKFEFGMNDNSEVILIDEALTPDSSRFWLLDDYQQKKTPTNFDKQILRDYLESIAWNKQPPPPTLPEAIIEKTLEKYQYALKIVTGQ
ncbi:MAG: phosphoribosylaminoimidazolesuccinocarboxamide synthase [Ignavibacteria bacterium]|jgi:phosphoribosylaminoimidazole-succinocarboxamide synthase|nr:phosphoribosylaminoimidazolesuccinocarboxamide synthase [Ignavibacteria bacterium]